VTEAAHWDVLCRLKQLMSLEWVHITCAPAPYQQLPALKRLAGTVTLTGAEMATLVMETLPALEEVRVDVDLAGRGVQVREIEGEHRQRESLAVMVCKNAASQSGAFCTCMRRASTFTPLCAVRLSATCVSELQTHAISSSSVHVLTTSVSCLMLLGCMQLGEGELLPSA
jgi:hypothetical protein